MDSDLLKNIFIVGPQTTTERVKLLSDGARWQCDGAQLLSTVVNWGPFLLTTVDNVFQSNPKPRIRSLPSNEALAIESFVDIHLSQGRVVERVIKYQTRNLLTLHNCYINGDLKHT